MNLTSDLVERILQMDGFLKNFTLNSSTIDDGKVELELDLTENLLRVGRTMNGGAIATILDFAGGLAVMSTGNVVNQVTTNLSIQFVRPAAKGPIRSKAWTIKSGKNMVFAEMELFDRDMKLCAKATGSWFVYRSG